jgi:mitochondrial fission protein ELM1
MSKTAETVWVLTDGRPGHIAQTLGLAEALTADPVVKRLALRTPYRQASPFLGWAGGRALTPESAQIAPPWPDIVVTSGRSAIPVALAIGRASTGKTLLVNVQDPGYFRSRFDLVIVPEHDGLCGPNIMSTLGALGRTTPARLAEAAKQFAPHLAHLLHPRVAVLVGGANAVFQTPPDVCARIAGDLAGLAAQGAGLMITFSRRTGPGLERAIRDALAGSGAMIWDGSGNNPYFAYLAMADHILATEDSASMVSEAAATGKPISILRLAGGSRKFSRFHEAMQSRGITQLFAGKLEDWRYAPLDETARAAAEVRRLLANHRVAL